MNATKFVFFTALDMEAHALRRAFMAAQPAIDVHVIGIRAVQLSTLPAFDRGSTIVVAGLAGGLDPQLRIGDVVLDTSDRVPTPANVVRGKIHTSHKLIDSTAEKSLLFASSYAAAVDMEQSIVAEWAAVHGHTVIGLRAISDSAADTLDPVVMTLIDPSGRPRPGAIASAQLRRPTLIFELLRLGKRSKLALANLSAAAVELARGFD